VLLYAKSVPEWYKILSATGNMGSKKFSQSTMVEHDCLGGGRRKLTRDEI